MPQRNGQNPIMTTKTFEHDGNKFNSGAELQTKNTAGYGICPKCKTEVPPKPGFRLSSLKCPKCQTLLWNK